MFRITAFRVCQLCGPAASAHSAVSTQPLATGAKTANFISRNEIAIDRQLGPGPLYVNQHGPSIVICASGEACGAFIVLPEVGEREVKGAATAPKAKLSLSLCALISFKLLS